MSNSLQSRTVDELCSDLYSITIEVFRDQVVQCLPQTEEMLSRSIIKSLFAESDCSSSVNSSFSDSTSERDPALTEAVALLEAYEWANLNLVYAAACDVEELALSHLGKHIESVLHGIRSDVLNAEEASHILLGVASVLGLKFAAPVKLDRVILCNLPLNVSVEDLKFMLSTYGDIEAAAVVRERSFGLCRFADETSAESVQLAADVGSFTIGGVNPRVYVVSGNLAEKLWEKKPEVSPDEKVGDLSKAVVIGRIPSTKCTTTVMHMMSINSLHIPQESFELTDDEEEWGDVRSRRPSEKSYNRKLMSPRFDRASVSPYSVIELNAHAVSMGRSAPYLSHLH
jgi:RNA recognition motif. (a.k.a. RRM, RBD, or RNP domain)